MSQTGFFCCGCGELNELGAQHCRKCGAPQTAGALTSSPPPVAAAPAAAAVAPALQASPVPPPAYGTVFGDPGAPGAFPAPQAYGATAAYFGGYAGFWIRVAATLIDGLVIGVPVMVVLGILIAAIGAMGAAGSRGGQPNPAILGLMMLLVPLSMLAIFAVNWLYEAYMTSSTRQATLGKMALGLKVIDSNGNRLSFMHATGRHFAKYINGFIMNIGYVMVAFTDRKQGLHDMIAGTYVIRT